MKNAGPMQLWFLVHCLIGCIVATGAQPIEIRTGPTSWSLVEAQVMGFVDNRNGVQTDPTAVKIAQKFPGPHVCVILRPLRSGVPDTARVYVVYWGLAAINQLTPKETKLWSTTSEYVSFGTTIHLPDLDKALKGSGGFMIIANNMTIRNPRRLKPPRTELKQPKLEAAAESSTSKPGP
jgi:hypothetical protein